MSETAIQETQTVALSRLIRDAKFQVRRKLDQPTINRYVEVLKAGNEMPPIRVALINGAHVLIDGWHRVEAMERRGKQETTAIVVQADEKEAYWLAAKANMEHGLPLKHSERREVFGAYVKAGQHRKNRRQYKSYREMQRDLSISFSTIRHWMHEDFGDIAARIGGNDDFKGKGGLRSGPETLEVRKGAIQGLDEARRAFQSTVDPEARGEIISHMDELLADMKQSGNWTLPVESDF